MYTYCLTLYYNQCDQGPSEWRILTRKVTRRRGTALSSSVGICKRPPELTRGRVLCSSGNSAIIQGSGGEFFYFRARGTRTSRKARTGTSTVDQFFWSESRTSEFLGRWRWKRWCVQNWTKAVLKQAVGVCDNVVRARCCVFAQHLLSHAAPESVAASKTHEAKPVSLRARADVCALREGEGEGQGEERERAREIWHHVGCLCIASTQRSLHSSA